MVYLLKMVIFHGELLNNQMVMRLLIFVGTSEREREREGEILQTWGIFLISINHWLVFWNMAFFSPFSWE